MSARITLVGAGDTVYVYPDAADPAVSERVAAQVMVFTAMYPADDDPTVRTINADAWPDLRAKLTGIHGVEIIDTRPVPTPDPTEGDTP